jgi:hypothetical protein
MAETYLTLDALEPIDRTVARASGNVADQVEDSGSENTR